MGQNRLLHHQNYQVLLVFFHYKNCQELHLGRAGRRQKNNDKLLRPIKSCANYHMAKPGLHLKALNMNLIMNAPKTTQILPANLL